jgi:hypothetical protein
VLSTASAATFAATFAFTLFTLLCLFLCVITMAAQISFEDLLTLESTV